MTPPNPSLKYLVRHEEAKAWRVELPARVGKPKATYFNDSDYGGKTPAMVEAQYHRDAFFANEKLPLEARVRRTKKMIDRGETLSIREVRDRGRHLVVGRWQYSTGGTTKTKTVARSVRLYGYEVAYAQVHAAVTKGVSDEAARVASAGMRLATRSRKRQSPTESATC